jgi:4-hydroxybenzoate polyprenyltransferase
LTKGLLYREFVLGGHLLALGTASIAAVSAYLAGFAPTWDLLAIGYLFSYGAYTVNRGADIEQDALSNPERTTHLASRKRLLPMVAAVYFGLGYLLVALRGAYFFIAMLSPLLLSLAYSVGSKRLVRVVGAKRLKDKLLVKNIVTSLSWSLIPVLVGFYFLAFPAPLLLLAPFISLRLMANTVFFDVRDASADLSFGTRTIPNVFGVGKAFVTMGVADALSAVYIASLVVTAVLPSTALVFLILPVYSFAYRWLSRRVDADMDMLCDLVADGEYILWGPLFYIARI